MVMSGPVHEFDHTLVTVRRTFEPLVAIDHILHTVNVELEIWDRLMLFFRAITDHESRRRFVTIHLSFEEMVVNFIEIRVWDHV